ncbi:aldose epimerase family protein [Candidatus Burkholderia verschuerenii]|uniref:aldose epimerase family protein n=1 Tax=Candidatus Burkholderia verschuerenii TaxID=242163 RepID=UPI001E5B8951|nr:aldose epimerase [Candidatus Burkholderia verschuerenii]
MTQTREVFELKAEPRVVIRRGAHAIELAPSAGGRITRFFTGDASGVHDWLAPIHQTSWPADAWPKGGSYPLVPFSNRVRDSHFPGPDGETVRLAAFPSMAHALHGFGQYADWRIERREADVVEMRYEHRAGEHGWPWAFEAIQTIEMTDDGARLSMRVINRSSRVMPIGLGFHPYFAAVDASLDTKTLWRHEGEIAIEPTDETPVREHRREDQGYTRYLSGWNGRATLRYADGRALDLKADGMLNHVVVHCPAGAGYLCVEPVSHVSDGFNLDAKGLPGTGIAFMRPGSETSASLSMASRRAPGPARRRLRLIRASTRA